MQPCTALISHILGVPNINRSQSTSISELIHQCGAGDRSRTRDILITSEALYQLSYTGIGREARSMVPSGAGAIGPGQVV